MNRRSLIKVTSCPLIATFAGCSSLNSNSDNQDPEENNNESLTDGETSNESDSNEKAGNKSNESDEIDQEEPDRELDRALEVVNHEWT